MLQKDVDREALLEAVARGCSELVEVYSFDRPNLDFPDDEARKMMISVCGEKDRLKIDLFSALMSDASVRNGKVRATPFCAMFGQGHQNFLERLETVPKGIPPKELQKTTTAEMLNSAAKLEEALFQPWERHDPTQSFRWDPVEDRRYALRFEDPSTDKGLTVHGANRLASLALPLLTAVPKRERGEIRLYALGTHWEAGALIVQWPVWSHPASVKAILFMLAGCGTEGRYPGLGIAELYQCERISVGKFFNFTRAMPVR
ncbi:MAG TPA: hypothetical protein VMD76_02075 [Candidatus Sulfotelmatobacter sp.]|nr:hypothetical protein [Candidatus Sulfotelmatobacter sp.]